jgi:hypothetical protein
MFKEADGVLIVLRQAGIPLNLLATTPTLFLGSRVFPVPRLEV